MNKKDMETFLKNVECKKGNHHQFIEGYTPSEQDKKLLSLIFYELYVTHRHLVTYEVMKFGIQLFYGSNRSKWIPFVEIDRILGE